MRAHSSSIDTSLGQRDSVHVAHNNGRMSYSGLVPTGTGEAIALIINAPMSASELVNIAHMLTCVALAKGQAEEAYDPDEPEPEDDWPEYEPL